MTRPRRRQLLAYHLHDMSRAELRRRLTSAPLTGADYPGVSSLRPGNPQAGAAKTSPQSRHETVTAGTAKPRPPFPDRRAA